MRPDKRIGKEMIKNERRWLCQHNARNWSTHYKRTARKASRIIGKRECLDW